MNKAQSYRIVRFYMERGKSQRVIKRNLTLEEAQQHCNDPAAEKQGEWFDGFESEESN